MSPNGGHAEAADSRWRRSLPIAVWLLVFATLTAMMVNLGLIRAFNFSGTPIDGPFQLYNALRRIAAGQRGGVDFQFFHGIGIPYFYYLPFRLFGGTFAASELGRQLIATLSGPLMLLALFRVYTRDWTRTVALGSIVLALSIGLGLWPMLLAVNSLLGPRTILPTLVAAFWILPIAPRVRALITGAVIGASVLLGTEQGLAVLIAVVVVNAV